MRGFLLAANVVGLLAYTAFMWDEFRRTSSPDLIPVLLVVAFGLLMALNIGYIQNTPADPNSKVAKFFRAFASAWKQDATR